MRVAIVTFDGFNELDSFIALGLLNRLSVQGWKAEIASPAAKVTSMNGVTVQAQQPLEFANSADIVLFGSGIYTRAIADSFGKKGSVLDRLQLDPVRQTIGGQCSGVLLMARLGLLADQPAATDLTTRPWLMEACFPPVRAAAPVANGVHPMPNDPIVDKVDSLHDPPAQDRHQGNLHTTSCTTFDAPAVSTPHRHAGCTVN